MDKEEFLEKARHANDAEIKQTKLSDLADKDSSFYKSTRVMPKETEVEIPVKTQDPYEIPNVRTFKADVAGAVKTEDLSMTKIAMKEVAKKQDSPNSPTDSSSKMIYIMLGVLGGLLILGGISAVIYSVFFLKTKEKEAVVIQPIVKKVFIRTDSDTSLELSDKTSRDIFAAINAEIKNPPKLNGVRKITFQKTAGLETTNSSLQEILTSFESKIPEDLNRTLKKEPFAGINFINGEGEPFFVIFGESYDSLFAGMLSWEEDLPEDMSVIFGKDPTATTTDKYLFKDGIIENKDVRTLLDKDKKIRFFYSILEGNVVFFGNSQRTFKEVLERIREAQLTK